MVFFSIDGVRFMRGFSYGLRYPSIIADTSIDKSNIMQCSIEDLASKYKGFFLKLINKNYPDLDLLPIKQFEGDILRLAIFIFSYFFKSLNLDIFDNIKFVELKNNEHIQSARILIPVNLKYQKGIYDLFNLIFNLLNEFDNIQLTEFENSFKRIMKKLSFQNSSNLISSRFNKAAYELKIPFYERPGNFFQYGLGSNARLINHSFTDETSHLGANLVKNKIITTAILRSAGFPVTQNYIVSNFESAKKMASKLGYPVVIKPYDLDAGIGVYTNIKTEKNLEKYFVKAQKYSKNILIERHYTGCDYRLLVYKGNFVWAIQRIPGGVLGDGMNSINKLLIKLNDSEDRKLLKKIELDEEAMELLDESNLTPDSILNLNQFLSLRHTANISRGGTPKAVNEIVHKDNKSLAIRAARLLNIDLCGIDIIMPDISQSWLKTGAVIIEANAEPDIGGVTSSHLYAELLNLMLKNKGLIPVIFILGSEINNSLPQDLVSNFISRGYRVGSVLGKKAFINHEIISPSVENVHKATNILIYDRTIDILIISINDFSLIDFGNNLSCINHLILAGKYFDTHDEDEINDLKLKQLLQNILPYVREGVVNLDTSNWDMELLAPNLSDKLIYEELNRDQLFDYLNNK